MKHSLTILVLVGVLFLVHNFLGGNLLVIKNYGISFGLNGIFWLFLNIIFILFFLDLSFKKGGFFILILSGGLVNFMDRIRWGYVRDYWNFLGMGLYNNINDWIIGIGVLFCLFNLLWKKSK